MIFRSQTDRSTFCFLPPPQSFSLLFNLPVHNHIHKTLEYIVSSTTTTDTAATTTTTITTSNATQTIVLKRAIFVIFFLSEAHLVLSKALTNCCLFSTDLKSIIRRRNCHGKKERENYIKFLRKWNDCCYKIESYYHHHQHYINLKVSKLIECFTLITR